MVNTIQIIQMHNLNYVKLFIFKKQQLKKYNERTTLFHHVEHKVKISYIL